VAIGRAADIRDLHQFGAYTESIDMGPVCFISIKVDTPLFPLQLFLFSHSAIRAVSMIRVPASFFTDSENALIPSLEVAFCNVLLCATKPGSWRA